MFVILLHASRTRTVFTQLHRFDLRSWKRLGTYWTSHGQRISDKRFGVVVKVSIRENVLQSGHVESVDDLFLGFK